MRNKLRAAALANLQAEYKRELQYASSYQDCGNGFTVCNGYRENAITEKHLLTQSKGVYEEEKAEWDEKLKDAQEYVSCLAATIAEMENRIAEIEAAEAETT